VIDTPLISDSGTAGMFTLSETPSGKPFFKTIFASLAPNLAAKSKSELSNESSETAIAGIPSIEASVAAETVPE
jgi:hypothetical protein